MIQVHTYGCKVNTYDSSLLEQRLRSSEGEFARVHVLNTCAVTQEATREAQRQIRRLKARDPFCTVVVTGCAAQVDTDSFSSLAGADLVVANSHKGQLIELLRKHFRGELDGRVFKSNIFRKEDLEPGGGLEESHTRAFLKIQDGCNSFCTFCVIPFARGKSRSLSASHLCARVNELSARGLREVVLTGVHIGDYRDGENRLEDLVEQICEHTTIERVRLSSLEPVELTPRLLDLFAHPKMCRHFHMSIQSVQTPILKAMRRHYRAEEVERALLAIRARYPDAFVGMDVIVGFPGESDDDFALAWQKLNELSWTRLHVFPYSERPGTRAVALPQSVALEIRAARARRLRELSRERYLQRAQELIGQKQKVLVLEEGLGLSRNYWKIEFDPSLAYSRGEEIDVEVTALSENAKGLDQCLRGRVLA